MHFNWRHSFPRCVPRYVSKPRGEWASSLRLRSRDTFCCVITTEKNDAEREAYRAVSLCQLELALLPQRPLEPPPPKMFPASLGLNWFVLWPDFLLLQGWKLVQTGKGGTKRLGEAGPAESHLEEAKMKWGSRHLWYRFPVPDLSPQGAAPTSHTRCTLRWSGPGLPRTTECGCLLSYKMWVGKDRL